MPNRSLSYKVGFDTRSAVSDLQRLTREGKKTGEEIADGFDKAETAGTNALRALTRQLDQMETDAKGAGRAAEAIGREMGDGFDSGQIAGFVADLKRIGVGFDEIEQRAGEFADVLRRVDDVKLDDGNVRQFGAAVDDAGDKARRSADTIQSGIGPLRGLTDEFGASSTAAGTWGNAIIDAGEAVQIFGGQLGFSEAGLAKIATGLGLAGLAAGIALPLITGLFKNDNKQAVENAHEAADALGEVTGVAQRLADQLAALDSPNADFGDRLVDSLAQTDDSFSEVLAAAQELGIETADVGDIIAGMGEKGAVEGLIPLFESVRDTLGLTDDEAIAVTNSLAVANGDFGEFERNLAGTNTLSNDWAEQNERIIGQYLRLGQAAVDTDIEQTASDWLTQLRGVEGGVEAITDARDRLADKGILDPSDIEIAYEIGEAVNFAALTIDDANTALQQFRQKANQDTDPTFLRLAEDMADGVIDDLGTLTWLTETYGITADEAFGIAAQRAADAEAAAADLVEQTDAARDAITAILDEGIDGAGELGRLFDLGDQTVDFQGAKAAVDDAIAGLQEYIDANGAIDWSALLDTAAMSPGSIDADMVAAVSGVRDALQEGISSAFELGGTDAAQHFLDTFLPQLLAQGLSPEEAYALLGLPADGSIAAAIQPYVDEQAEDRARRILDALAGTGIDAARVAQLQVAIDTGQLDGEQAAIVAQLEAWQLGVAVFPEVDDQTTAEEIRAAQRWLEQHPATVPIEGDATGAESEAQGFRRDAGRDPAVVPIDGDGKQALDELGAITGGDYQATINANLVQQLIAGLFVNAYLDYAARPRTVDIGVRLVGADTANLILDNVARDRTTTVTVDANTWGLQQAIATAIWNAIRLGRITN